MRVAALPATPKQGLNRVVVVGLAGLRPVVGQGVLGVGVSGAVPGLRSVNAGKLVHEALAAGAGA